MLYARRLEPSLIFSSMQKKPGMGHPFHDIDAGGIVDAPTGGQVQTSHHRHSVYGGIRPHPADANPFHCVKIKAEGLIAGVPTNKEAGCGFF